MQSKIVGGMATIASRLKSLEGVVQSIAPQLSVLYIYLNDHKEIPGFLAGFPNVVPILGGRTYGDLNANGKMMFLEHENSGIAFTLDDDIIYPSNYVENFLRAFQDFDYQVCLTVHGSVIPDHARWYYERLRTYAMKDELRCRMPVNLVGSGTSAFPIDRIGLDASKFKALIYVDLQVSLSALRNGLPLVSLERPGGWLTPVAYEGLWETFRGEITHHTHILRDEPVWQTDGLRGVWRDVYAQCLAKGIADPTRHLNLSPEMVGFLNGDLCLSNHDDFILLRKCVDFSSLWSG